MTHSVTRFWFFLLAVMFATTCALDVCQPEPDSAAPTAAASTVEWVTREVKAPRVSFHTFDSAAAKTKVSYHLYTPAAYDAAASKDRRFPVVYWLHGSGGRVALGSTCIRATRPGFAGLVCLIAGVVQRDDDK